MFDVYKCAYCKKESPVEEMEVCMHGQMHRYVCDLKCMRLFYNPPKKAAESICDLCNKHDSGLVKGVCKECRDRYDIREGE